MTSTSGHTRIHPALAAFLTVALAVIGAAGGGCSARTANSPNPSPVPWNSPTTMAIVLENVRQGFDARSAGNYQRSLDPNFVLVPDPADVTESGDPTFWQNWNRQQEVQISTALFNLPDSTTITFTWPNESRESPRGTDQMDEYYYRDLEYRLVVTHAGHDTVISGKTDLYMRETNGLFSIVEWLDKRDGSLDDTWGFVHWKRTLL